MNISFGVHNGRSYEYLVLKEPYYCSWICTVKNPTGPMPQAICEVRRLIEIFDNKPFICKTCFAKGCEVRATRFSVYVGNSGLDWWCGGCSPYQSHVPFGKLYLPNTYYSALDYVHQELGGSKKYCKNIIKEMAIAKSLPARCGESQAQAFFK